MAAIISRVITIDSGRSVQLQRHWLPMHRLPPGVRVCWIARWPHLEQFGGIGSSGPKRYISGVDNAAEPPRGTASACGSPARGSAAAPAALGEFEGEQDASRVRGQYPEVVLNKTGLERRGRQDVQQVESAERAPTATG
jgi:hypothetical protein